MRAYEAGLKASDTRLLLSPNTEFFRYFNDPSGARSSPTPAVKEAPAAGQTSRVPEAQAASEKSVLSETPTQ